MYACTEKGFHYWRESVKTAVAIYKVEKDADIWNTMWAVNDYNTYFNDSFKKYFLVEKLILNL